MSTSTNLLLTGGSFGEITEGASRF